MRKIYLIGEINGAMYQQFSEQLDMFLAEDAVAPIEIELCSTGGEDATAFAFFGKMNSSTAPLNVTAYGAIYSAAILILAAGDTRSVDAGTSLMVHESSDELSGETGKLKREVEWMELMETEFYQRLADCTTVTLDTWKAFASETTYFTASQAWEFGLADKVVNLNKNRKVSR